MQNAANNTNISTKEILSSYLKTIDGLTEVEQLIKSKLKSEASALTEVSGYLLNLGGKRIRPALCLICARAINQQNQREQLIQISAGIELIHMATLLHDDIIDKSKVRRHKSSPLIKYGSNETLLTGDFLLVRAFSLCAKLDQYIIEITENACVDLTEGEILEIPLNLKKHTLQSSLLISKKKTASLFRLACECAAHLSSEISELTKSFASFGENIGTAFQIVDDILDVTSTEEILGKEPGSDIKERKPSVVNVLWLDSGSTLAKKLLIEPGEDESDFVKNSLDELRSSEIIPQAKKIAAEFVKKALGHLEQAESLSADKNQDAFLALRGLTEYCLQRME